jgi:hypothetical protein
MKDPKEKALEKCRDAFVILMAFDGKSAREWEEEVRNVLLPVYALVNKALNPELYEKEE